MHVASLPLWRALRNAALSLAFAAAAAAQTPDQLDIFRNLTPEQQRAVMEGMTDASLQQDNAVPAQGTRQSSDTEADARRQADRRPAAQDAEIPVLKPEDTVLVEAALSGEKLEQLAPVERSRVDAIIELIRSRNPYQLDRNAQLTLPGFSPIELRGLSEKQATQRLLLEPALRPLDMRVTRSPVAKSGAAGLKRYGYDFFDNAPSTISPVTDMPVPADYVMGPGDELNVQLYGSQNRNLRLTVSREGTVSFPEIGPIGVGGLSFRDARRAIESRVGSQLIGVQVSVTLRETRTIRVTVTGEARQAGSYIVGGLATIKTALFASGGVKDIGSLRNIELKRRGEVVGRLDLYDLLIRGDDSDDAALQSGDVIFIPTVGSTVSVDGEVKRPAIYELRDETGVADVVRIAGGLTPEADATRASLTQIEQGRRVVVDVNLDQLSDNAQRVRNGAVLHIGRLRPQIDAGVELAGLLHRPGPVAWHEGLRLSDVIGSMDELLPGADPHYISIRRESGSDRRISPLSGDLVAALAAPGSAADVLLAPRDRITVIDLAAGRERIIKPLIDELRLQSGLAQPPEIVEVGGRVKVPGEYPLEPGMRISGLLRAGGSLDASAFGAEAELTRYVINAAGERRPELIVIDLAAVRSGDASADITLQPFDYLMVKETPDWGGQEYVTLLGEVRFPGRIPIHRGETLGDVLVRAGGLTTLAFPEGSRFTRQDLRKIEQQMLDRLAQRMRADLAALALQAANAGQADSAQALQSGQSLLADLQNAEATGRFVIDLPGLIAMGSHSAKDVLLRDGDELVIPKLRQEVTVIGEVQNPTSHLFLTDLKRDEYISKSGGTTRKADRGRIQVVRADGSTATQKRSWLARSYNVAIKPGDTIVVPVDTERIPRLPLWQAVTQILYNVAVSVAAINSF